MPRALVQAAAFIAENSLHIAEYLKIYRGSGSTKIQLLGENYEDDIRGAGIKNPVATIWLISFEHIREYRVDHILLTMALIYLDMILLPPISCR